MLRAWIAFLVEFEDAWFGVAFWLFSIREPGWVEFRRL